MKIKFHFKNKKKEYDLLIFILLLMVFCIIISSAVLIFQVVKKSEIKGQSISDPVVKIFENDQKQKVLTEYTVVLDNLQEDIKNMTESEAKIAVEDWFFSVRVPSEMLDYHMQAFLDFNSYLEEKKSDKVYINSILDNLHSNIK